jgi:cation diffusion facilitator family transporter
VRIKPPPISARRVVWTSLIVDISDLMVNLAVAILSGSVVILAEALQGAADLITSILLVVGVNHARRRPTRRYRFGYGRELFFWILMAGVSMIVITATLSIYFGVQRILRPQVIHYLPLAYGALIIGLVTNLYALSISLRRLEVKLGHFFWKRVLQSAHIETKATLILDLMGSAASMFGIASMVVYQLTGDARFDGVGAILVGAFTAILAVILILEVKSLLVGRSASPEIEDEIRDVVTSVVGVRQLLDLRTMYLGSNRLLVNVEVHLEQNLRTAQIEQLMDQIKQTLKQQVPVVHHVQVELETPNKRQLLS